MNQLANAIDNFTEKVGRTISWISLILVAVIGYDVMMRYIFDSSSASAFEMEWHLFAALFLLGLGYTLKHDKHVRVDVFYSKFSIKGKALVNLVGTAIFLIPFSVVVIKTSLPFVMDSFRILESSPDPGGLPFRFIIKSAIPIGMSLLLLQAISSLLKNLSVFLNQNS